MNENFMKLYGTLPRAGPGDFEHTKRAFKMIRGLPPNPKILDIGCGPGVQTMDLATLTDGKIIAIDLLPQMIGRLNEKIIENKLENRVQGLIMDMNKLDFPQQEFDLV